MSDYNTCITKVEDVGEDDLNFTLYFNDNSSVDIPKDKMVVGSDSALHKSPGSSLYLKMNGLNRVVRVTLGNTDVFEQENNPGAALACNHG
jgi:hypothetical protein